MNIYYYILLNKFFEIKMLTNMLFNIFFLKKKNTILLTLNGKVFFINI